MSQTIIYSTPTCPYCRYVKQFLDGKGIPYIEKNVAADQMAAMEMVRRSGQQGVPVTVIGDEVIIGFNQPALNQAVAKIKMQSNNKINPANNGFKLGAKAADAAAVLAGQGKPAQPGVIIGAAIPGGAAALAGLREGDIIVALGSHSVHNLADLQKALIALSNLPIAGLARATGLTYIRDGQQLQTKLPLKHA
jgi:glutaredoxin-like YruB-family protein